MPNPLIPKETRPKLTADEAMAICDYSGDLYPDINNPLRDGKPLSAKAQVAYDEMQKAFDKAKPFPEPIKVQRGMDFKDPAKLKAFITKCTAVVGTQNVMRLEGFTSTGTAGIPPAFEGNVVITFIAKKGLDLLPYSQSQHEKELLLNHNTPVLVHRCVQKGKTWEITMEQVLEKPTKKKT